MKPGADSFYLQLWVLLVVLRCVGGFFGLTARESVLILTADFEDRVRALQLGRKISSVDLCNMLDLQRKQKRECMTGRGVAETLVRACRLSALECQYQFQNERWSCLLLDYRKHLLKKGPCSFRTRCQDAMFDNGDITLSVKDSPLTNHKAAISVRTCVDLSIIIGFKEVSFMFAISSAGLVHELARACALGLIDRCTCDDSKHLENTVTWRWGGCGDNIRFGLQFTRRFLRDEGRTGKDVRARVDEHNSAVGINAVKGLVNTRCKCHGVSGSCAVKTCWLQLSRFKMVGAALKLKYDKAVRVVSLPNQVAGAIHLMRRRKNLRELPSSIEGVDLVPLKKVELTYIESSPNFCKNSNYSPGTSGRTCTKGENCDEMCCGRGHNVEIKVFKTNCKCEAIWCCKITCKTCLVEKDVYLCK